MNTFLKKKTIIISLKIFLKNKKDKKKEVEMLKLERQILFFCLEIDTKRMFEKIIDKGNIL